MLRREFLRSNVALAALLAAGDSKAWAGAAGASWQEAKATPGPFPVVLLEGSARERGRAHGETLRAEILEMVERWRKGLGKKDDETVEAYVRGFVRGTRFADAIRKWTPDLLEEVFGISEGSGAPYDTVFAMQCIDEEWWWSMNRRIEAPSGKGDKCSVVAGPKSAGGPSLIAQNLDLPATVDGHLKLFRIREGHGRPEQLVFSHAGCIALNGMNDRGLAVAVNTLLALDNDVEGLPVAHIVRGVLACEDVAAAAKFLTTVRHASGQAYTLGDREGIACFEGSAHGASRVPPDPKTGRIVHTNHPLTSTDFGLIGRHALEQEAKTPDRGLENSRCRLAAVARAAGNPDIPLTVGSIKSALSTHDSDADPVCRHFKSLYDGFTAACTIYELGPSPRLHIAPNPPCRSALQVVGFG